MHSKKVASLFVDSFVYHSMILAASVPHFLSVTISMHRTELSRLLKSHTFFRK